MAKPSFRERFQKGLKQVRDLLLRFPPFKYAYDLGRNIGDFFRSKSSSSKKSATKQTKLIQAVHTLFARYNITRMEDEGIRKHPAEFKALLTTIEILEDLGYINHKMVLALQKKFARDGSLNILSLNLQDSNKTTEDLNSFITNMSNALQKMKADSIPLYNIILGLKTPSTTLVKLAAYGDLIENHPKDMYFLQDSNLSDNDKLEILQAFRVLDNAHLLSAQLEMSEIKREIIEGPVSRGRKLDRVEFAENFVKVKKGVNPLAPPAVLPSDPLTVKSPTNTSEQPEPEKPKPRRNTI